MKCELALLPQGDGYLGPFWFEFVSSFFELFLRSAAGNTLGSHSKGFPLFRRAASRFFPFLFLFLLILSPVDHPF